jgi:hypothetical protein
VEEGEDGDPHLSPTDAGAATPDSATATTATASSRTPPGWAPLAMVVELVSLSVGAMHEVCLLDLRCLCGPAVRPALYYHDIS